MPEMVDRNNTKIEAMIEGGRIKATATALERNVVLEKCDIVYDVYIFIAARMELGLEVVPQNEEQEAAISAWFNVLSWTDLHNLLGEEWKILELLIEDEKIKILAAP